MMYVDEKTMNIEDRRADGSVRDELIVRVYADSQSSGFTLYEDEGATTAYQHGEVRTTMIRQEPQGDAVVVTIEAATGDYEGALTERQNVIQLYAGRSAVPESVSLNGELIPRLQDESDFEGAEAGWMLAPDGAVRVKSGVLGVVVAKRFEFHFPG